jgi:hypothetical protein
MRKLAGRAAAGETVRLMPRGKPALSIKMRAQRIELLALPALTDAMPLQQESRRDLVRGLRDQGRY